MTQNRIKFIRCATMSLMGLVYIVLFTFILKNLPGFFDSCRIVAVIAKIFRVLAYIMLFMGISAYLVKDVEDVADLSYSPLLIFGVYELLLLFFFLWFRLFGYHQVYAFADITGVLLIIYSSVMIVALSLVYNARTRRLLFENKTWRTPNDNQLVKEFSGFGMIFSVMVIIITLSVEGTNSYLFKASGEDCGCGYVDLGLHSGAQCNYIPSYYKGEYGITFIGRNKKRLFILAAESATHNDT